MRLVERTGERLVFHLAARERAFLERLTSFFPLRSENPAVISRTDDGGLTEARTLLVEALDEHREALGRWLQRQLGKGGAYRRSGEGWLLDLKSEDIERLLQVLNELRVGAWEKLGSPEDLGDERLLDEPGRAPLYAIMTVAGQIQMALLHALWGDMGPGDGAGA